MNAKLFIMFLGLVVFGYGCSVAVDEGTSQRESQGDNGLETSNADWLNFELSEVETGETFTLGGFDKPVLVESFAVWCPTCTKQQREVKKLHEDVGDSIISIALDTDPNEDVNTVRDHKVENGFDWRYSVSPPELTKLLISEFGVSFINAPSAPMALICPDGTFKVLPRGVKDASELKEFAGECSAI